MRTRTLAAAGTLPSALACSGRGLQGIIIPPSNSRESALAGTVAVYPFGSLPEVVDFLAKIVVQERDGKPRPRYRLEIENVRPAGESPEGTKQVTATCEKCGGPGITTEEGLKRSGGKLSHKDPAICANVRRNTGSK